MARNTCGVIIGVLLVLVGVGLLILGLVVTPKELPPLFKDQVDKYVVVDNDKAGGYAGWAGQNDVDNPYYLVVYMFNLTNMEDVRSEGAVPNYQQVGPYMFRRYRQSLNVTFLENGQSVQYNDFADYFFDQNASAPSLSQDDMFTNINPVYVGALMQAYNASNTAFPSEVSIMMAASGGYVRGFINYLTGPSFLSLCMAYNMPSFFIPIMNANIAALNATYGDQAYDEFVNVWRGNISAPAVGDWTGIPSSTGVPFSSAQLLLNASIPYSLLDTSYEGAWYWNQYANNETIAQNLMDWFQVSRQQLDAISLWRDTVFAPAIMYPHYTSTYGLSDISDIGWVQFATEKPLSGSVSNIAEIQTLGFYTSIELDDTTPTAYWQEWKSILNPDTGLQNLTVLQDFLMEYSATSGSGNFAPYGLNASTAMAYGGYLAGLAMNQAIPAVTANLGQTGGLFVTRSVNQWTFNCDDYLLNLLREIPPVCSFKSNHTTTPPNVIYSGKNNISLINNYQVWQGQSTVNFWQAPVNVSGFTELGQFEPGHTDRTPYPVFQEDTARVIYLNYSSEITLQGIKADRYILDFQKTFGANPFYFQPEGLANLTSVQFGSPIFLSLWDMLYVPNATSMVSGLNQTNELEENTLIDIEPTTGTTIQARRRMQVNVYVAPDNAGWFGPAPTIFNNENFTSGIVYPIAKLGEYATISSSQATKLHNKLAIPPKVRHATFYAGVIGGPILIVVGICVIFTSRRRHNHQHDERDPLVVNRRY